MSSSSTERATPVADDRRRRHAPDGRLGLRGHDRRVAQAGRRLGRVRGGDRRHLDRQDRHRGPVAGGRARGRDRGRGRHDGRGRHRARAPGHRRQARAAARLRAERRAADQRGRGGDRRDAGARRPRRRRRSRARPRPTRRRARGARRGARRYSPVVQRIAAEHDVDLDQVQGTGRDGRVRKQDVLAFIESGRRGAAEARRGEPPLHIESPYRPDAAGAEAAPRRPPRRARRTGRCRPRPLRPAPTSRRRPRRCRACASSSAST